MYSTMTVKRQCHNTHRLQNLVLVIAIIIRVRVYKEIPYFSVGLILLCAIATTMNLTS